MKAGRRLHSGAQMDPAFGRAQPQYAVTKLAQSDTSTGEACGINNKGDVGACHFPAWQVGLQPLRAA